MNVREVLEEKYERWVDLPSPKTPFDAWVSGDIEKGLRAAYRKGFFCNDGKPNTKHGVTAGIAAMTEES